jgi:hypothetical protein
MSECQAMDRSEAKQRTRLLARIAAGESLASITRDLAMPSRPQVCEWLWADADFATAFRAARARGTDLLAEECLEIADEVATTAVEVADKRLRIDARLKLMARWQRVGERDTPEPRLDMAQLTDEQLDVLASIPIVDDEPRSAGGSAQCASDDVFDDRQDVVAPAAPEHPAEARTPLSRDDDTTSDVWSATRESDITGPALDAANGDASAVASEAHDDLRAGSASQAPAQDPIMGRSLPGDREGAAANQGRTAAPASADQDADAADKKEPLGSPLHTPGSVGMTSRAKGVADLTQSPRAMPPDPDPG